VQAAGELSFALQALYLFTALTLQNLRLQNLEKRPHGAPSKCFAMEMIRSQNGWVRARVRPAVVFKNL